MLRPWLYVDELIDRFAYYRNKENLANKLKEIYSNVAELEEIAEEKEISILEPCQGKNIGDFTVLAPTKDRYLDLIVESEKTPKAAKKAASRVLSLTEAAWGEETFSTEGNYP